MRHVFFRYNPCKSSLNHPRVDAAALCDMANIIRLWALNLNGLRLVFTIIIN